MPSNQLRFKKNCALERSGTLNPHPDRVLDEQFRHSPFFDPRDLLQVKYEMLRRVMLDGWSITQASQSFGFSRPSFYQIQCEFEEEGLCGLMPRQRGPKEAHKMTGAVLQYIDSSRQNDKSLSYSQLAEMISAKFGFTIHERSIERALARRKSGQFSGERNVKVSKKKNTK